MSTKYLLSLVGLKSEGEKSIDPNVTLALAECGKHILDGEDIPFFYFSFALVCILICSCIIPRQSLCLQKCGGKPGVVIPMNYLEDRRKVAIYIIIYCAYGSSVVSLFNHDASPEDNIFASIQEIHPAIEVVVKLIQMCLLGCACYPFFAIITQRHFVIAILCTIYTIGYTAIIISNYVYIFVCFIDIPDMILIQFFQYLPTLLALLFLSGYYIYLSCKLIHKRIKGEAEKPINSGPSSSETYVKNLFLRKRWQTETKLSFVQKLKMKLSSCKYQKVHGFRYPPQFLACMAFIIIILYGISVHFFFALYEGYRVIDGFGKSMPSNETIKEIFSNLVNYNISAQPEEFFKYFLSSLGPILLYFARSVLIIVTISYILALIYSILSVGHMILNYRRAILSMTRGKYKGMIRIMDISEPNDITKGFILYLGYQVAYLVISCLVYFAVLSTTLSVFGVAFVIPIHYGFGRFWLTLLENYWPPVAVSILIMALQMLVCRLFFTLDDGKTSGVRNRRALFVFMHFIFFYNILLGVFSLILRLIKGIFFGLVFLGRLDYALFPRYVESKDKPHAIFLSYLYTENLVTNPLLCAFVEHLASIKKHMSLDNWGNPIKLTFSGREEGRSINDELKDGCVVTIAMGTDREDKVNKKIRARTRWHVAYTLIWNPSLQGTRKKAIQAHKEMLNRFSENQDKSFQCKIKNKTGTMKA